MMKSAVFLLALSVVALQPAQAATATIDPTKTFQTIEGLGGAICFYNGWVTAHPYKLEIFTNAFAGLNLSMLRLGNWFRYQGTSNFDPDAPGFVTNANRVLGHPVPIYMSSWSPPAFLKSNGQVANGGSLIYSNGSFAAAYTNFANYWYDAIQAYQSNGVNLTWTSIQNEPDWVASYDSCIFHPNEETIISTNTTTTFITNGATITTNIVKTVVTNIYASYSKALDAVYQKLNNLPSPPKLLAPECVHISFNDLNNYAATMNSNSFYGVAHHLYGDGNAALTGDSFLTAISSATNVFRNKPHFMTEYGDVFDMIECANLIHNSLVVESVSGYNHWNLIWPGTNGGLIQIENPFATQSTWTNAPPGTPTQSHGWWYSPSYWSMKHFSYFIQPGFRRVSETDNDNNVRGSAFLSSNSLRLVVVMINTNPTVASAMTFNFGTFSASKSSVYQTAGTNKFSSLGALTNSQLLPPLSLTTIVLDQTNVTVGAATNPSPVNNASGIALNTTLSWTAGNNALGHALYLGINSNLVAQATSVAPEFQGVLATTNFSASLLSGLTYYWRVDEIAGINTNGGTVWSFSTVAPNANFTLSTSDVSGSSSFSSIGNWVTNGTANAATTPPGPGGAYNTGPFVLRSPAAGGPFTFAGSSLTISPGGSLYDKVGTVTMTVYNLTNIGVGPANAVGGTFTLLGNMYIRFNGGGMNTGSGNSSGTDNRTISCGMTISGPGALTNFTADANWPSHPTAQGTVIYTGNNTSFTGPQVIMNNTVVQVSSQANLGGNPANFNAAQLLLNNGTFQPLASFVLNNPSSGITIGANGGIFNVASGMTLTISNPIAGAGNLFCTGGGVLQIASSNSATGNLVVSNGTLAAMGTATFNNAQLGVSNNATLDVTALTVPLNISSGITLAGNLRAAINKTNFTSMLAAGNITYGGTLTLSNSGPALAYGDTIKLFSASNYFDAFSNIVPAAPGTGLIWNTNWLSLDGTIFISSTNPAFITPPRITSAQMQGGNVVVTGTNGNAPGNIFYTQASTNLALPLTNWMIVATNQFGAGGDFGFTNTIDSSKPWQFFIIRLP
jgi:glucuronoarabinoxylan endo-1,4-beta-xylanase